MVFTYPKCLREDLLKSQWNRPGRGPAFGCEVNIQRQYCDILREYLPISPALPLQGETVKKIGGFKSLYFHSLYLKKSLFMYVSANLS